MTSEIRKITKDDVLRFIDDTIEELENGSLTDFKDPIAVAKTIRQRVELIK